MRLPRGVMGKFGILWYLLDFLELWFRPWKWRWRRKAKVEVFFVGTWKRSALARDET